jgi:hypothetical protein
MNRFIRLTLTVVALASMASAAIVTMNSATFTGQSDLAVAPGSTDDGTTSLAATYSGSSSTIDLTTVGQTARLALGTLIIDENVAVGDSSPNITTIEHDADYGLLITVSTAQWGVLNFLATPGLFDLSGFSPGGSDDNTLDGPEEIHIDFATLFQDATFGNMTVRFSILDDAFGTDQQLDLNQGSAAETIFLQAEVLRIDEPNGEVPEPATMALAGSGLLALGWASRRRQVKS